MKKKESYTRIVFKDGAFRTFFESHEEIGIKISKQMPCLRLTEVMVFKDEQGEHLASSDISVMTSEIKEFYQMDTSKYGCRVISLLP